MPGPLGVTVFFFLSGYLITTLLRIEFAKTGTISLRAFYLRRAFRILPPLYLILIIAILLTQIGVIAQKLRFSAVAAQFFFLSNYQILQSGWDGPHSGRPLGTSSLWSLAIEEHFYLVFPLIYLGLCRFVPSRRRQAVVLGILCAFVLIWRMVLVFGLHASFDRTYVGTDTRFDSLLFGCILAVWGNPFLDQPSAGDSLCSRAGRLWAPALAPIGVVGLGFASGLVRIGPIGHFLNVTNVSATLQYTIEGLCLIPIFTVAVRSAGWGLHRALNFRPVMFIGVLSYSIYIAHMVIIAAINNLPGGHIEKVVMETTVTVLFAWAVYRVVEQPIARARRRLSRTGSLSPPAVTPRPETFSIPGTANLVATVSSGGSDGRFGATVRVNATPD
jgi:peptidoglycan/LPS O-acetylase OafA/YrhL